MIAIDTNVVAYFLIYGEKTPRAEAVRQRDKDWRVPPLFVHEWLNVIARHVQTGKFGRDEGLRTYRRGIAMVRIEQTAIDPLVVLNLTSQSGCSSYDCQFVALAQSLKVSLVTGDAEVLRAFPELTIPLPD